MKFHANVYQGEKLLQLLCLGRNVVNKLHFFKKNRIVVRSQIRQ